MRTAEHDAGIACATGRYCRLWSEGDCQLDGLESLSASTPRTGLRSVLLATLYRITARNGTYIVF